MLRMKRRLWIMSAILYVIALHAIIIALIVKTDFIERASLRLGKNEWSPSALDLIFRHYAPIEKGAVLMIGDSILAGLNPNHIRANMTNYAVGGETTRRLLLRMGTLDNIEHAGLIVVGVGINDLNYRDPEDIVRDYTHILSILKATPYIMLSVLPTQPQSLVVERNPRIGNDRIKVLNTLLRRLCLTQTTCVFLDSWPVIASTRKELYGDGVHLSEQGNATLEALISITVADILEKLP